MKLFILAFALTFVSQAFAGNEGGGGGAVVCRNGNEITSVELLDLFEAPIIHGFPIYKTDEIPFLQQLEERLKISYMPEGYSYFLTELASETLSRMQFLPDGIILETPDDVGERIPRIMKEGCKLEGLGFYTEEGKLLVSKVLFNRLSETDKAAFILHEVFYYLYRNNRTGRDSYIARKAVGHFMASESYRPGDRAFTFLINNIFAANAERDNLVIIPKREKWAFINIRLDKMNGENWEDGEYTVSCTNYGQNDVIDTVRNWGNQLFFHDANGTDVPFCRGIKIELKDYSKLEKVFIDYENVKIFDGKPEIPEDGQPIFIQLATVAELK